MITRDVNYYGLRRGTIAVERLVNGCVEWLALWRQDDYKEWPGSFCVL